MKRLVLSSLLCLGSTELYCAERSAPEVFFSVSRAYARRLAPADARTVHAGSGERASDSVAELLQEAAPLSVRRLNGPLGLATVSMRGFQARQTAVFLDDIRLPPDITGTVDLSVLPAAGLERAEILPGSAASAYGPGSGGGVVNLFTRRLVPGARLAQAAAEVSSYNTVTYTARTGAAGRAGEAFFAGSRNSSDGFQENSGIAKESASGRAALDLGPAGRLGVMGLFSRLRTGLPSGTPVPVGEWDGRRERAANSLTDWQSSRRSLVSASWAGGGDHASFRAESSLSANRIEAFQFGSLGGALVAERSFSGRLTLGGTAVIGAESSASSLDSELYGDHSLHSFGLFAQNTFTPARGFELTPGARLDRSGIYPGRVSPKLSAVYAPDEKWKFSAAAGYGFQPPTYADLYNPWAAPAPGLRPETSINSSAAAWYGSPSGWYAGLAGYYSDIKDRIALDPATWAAANLDSGFNSGLEAQAGYTGGPLRLSAGYTRNRSMVKTGGGRHERLNFSPVGRFNGAARAVFGAFEAGLDCRGVTAQYTGRGETGLRLPEYWVFGLGAGYNFGLAELRAGVVNVFDRHYAETADAFNGWFPQPGRTFTASFTWRLL